MTVRDQAHLIVQTLLRFLRSVQVVMLDGMRVNVKHTVTSLGFQTAF